MEGLLEEEEMIEVGMTEEGSCLERKISEHLSAQAEKWIKEGKVLPLREWVKQELPEGLTRLRCANYVSNKTEKDLYVKIQQRKISHELIGREPNEFIIIHSTTRSEAVGIIDIIYPGDTTFKIWLNPRNTEFQLIGEKLMMEKIKDKIKDKMCCNLF